MADDQPDHERVTESAEHRQHDRAERVEETLNRAADLLDEQKYPTTGEELATEYADEQIDLPNGTESLGSVFDRLVDERFESATAAREALYGEITGPAGPADESNEGRDLDDLDERAQDDLAKSGGSGE